ncbi:MAG: deoxyhypusine synthase [Candidatus Methanomethylicia archaeon]
MNREQILKNVVKDIDLSGIKSLRSLIIAMEQSGGFVAKKVGIGFNIIREMINDRDCMRFLSFPACIIATGCRGVIRELIKRKIFDIVITTCGTLDHDLARLWRPYHHGLIKVDDSILHSLEINRLGNVYIANENYGVILEEKLQEIFSKIDFTNPLSTRELIWRIGEILEEEEKKEESIIYWCYKNRILTYIPGITDGAFGFQLWMHSQRTKKMMIDILKDEQELADIVFTAKRTGALIIGGGISKHHTIWWNQFKNGLDYAIYITTAVEWDGSLSGARTEEAISWGKINEKARHITIEGDATVILPLLIGALFEE